MQCAQCGAFLENYQKAEQICARAIEAFNSSGDTSTRNFHQLQRKARKARAELDAALAELERHRRTHMISSWIGPLAPDFVEIYPALGNTSGGFEFAKVAFEQAIKDPAATTIHLILDVPCTGRYICNDWTARDVSDDRRIRTTILTDIGEAGALHFGVFACDGVDEV